MNKTVPSRESGFTLLEIMIAISLIIGLVLIFAQVVNNHLKTTKNIEQTSLTEKKMSALILELRASDFDSIKDAMERGTNSNYKCDSGIVPTTPSSVERFLYAWRELDTGLEFCMDIESYNFKLGGNVVDIKFRSVVRNLGTTAIIPLNTKFINMRKGR